MISIVMATLLGMAQPSYADLPTWRLFGIQITRGTETLTGYGIWISYWLDEANNKTSLYHEPKESFTDAELLEQFRNHKTVRFVSDVAHVNFPIKSIVALGPILEFPQVAISSITRSRQEHDGYTWYGVMNEYTPRIAKQLLGPPIAQCEQIPDSCKKDVCYGSIHWLSYNRAFPLSTLKVLCEGPYADINLDGPGLRNANIYKFEISGD